MILLDEAFNEFSFNCHWSKLVKFDGADEVKLCGMVITNNTLCKLDSCPRIKVIGNADDTDKILESVLSSDNVKKSNNVFSGNLKNFHNVEE
jgi:hypothetical protein